MQKIRKYFGEYDFTWIKVIIFAAITGIYTGLVNRIPILIGTSFCDIAISYEAWILFAVFITSNCKKWWEASLKCFAFFLISQPLVFLVESIFDGSFRVFMYYEEWFYITLLTLPGAAIAYLINKKKLLGVLSLSVAVIFYGFMAVYYINAAIKDPPYHILSAIFCILAAVFLILILFEDKKKRAALFAVLAISIIISGFLLDFGKANKKSEIILPEGIWNYEAENENIIAIDKKDDMHFEITAENNGNAAIYFKNAEGDMETYYITVYGGELFIDHFIDETLTSE